MYEIYVLGMGLVGVEELAGGWQLYLRTNTESFARKTYELLEESFDAWRDEDVAWYVDGGLTEYDWDGSMQQQINAPLSFCILYPAR